MSIPRKRRGWVGLGWVKASSGPLGPLDQEGEGEWHEAMDTGLACTPAPMVPGHTFPEVYPQCSGDVVPWGLWYAKARNMV